MHLSLDDARRYASGEEWALSDSRFDQDMRMKFEDDAQVQLGTEVDRSQGAARAISYVLRYLSLSAITRV